MGANTRFSILPRRKVSLRTRSGRRSISSTQWTVAISPAVPGDSDLEARLAAYELAFRMQATAPEAVDMGKESAATKKLYGIDEPLTDDFGRKCLLARRLVERGVRFVQLYSGTHLGDDWDGAHNDLTGSHNKMAAKTDKPIAALLTDLKARGLLDSTLVLWCSEFGRTPLAEGRNGRDHHPYAFSIWFAGAGVKGGRVYGATDEFGLRPVEHPIVNHDINATCCDCWAWTTPG